MGKLFSYDSVLIQTINKFVDCFCLSLLWILFSIPVITFGASTTALYYTVNKVICNDRSHIWREFWASFKSNFKQSTILWLILMIVYWLLGSSLIITYNSYRAGGSMAFFIMYVIIVGLFTMWSFYLFPYIARFENTVKQTMQNCLFFFVRHFISSFALLFIFVVIMILIYAFFPVLLIAPTVFMLFAVQIIERIFRKYMSDEDYQAEQERNRVYYN